jgi:hypothetical protein
VHFLGLPGGCIAPPTKQCAFDIGLGFAQGLVGGAISVAQGTVNGSLKVVLWFAVCAFTMAIINIVHGIIMEKKLRT